ncbi:DDE_3 domain-containing protein [Trichonephila clavipes]|nr:DDE_3 domain-containing protein [Trichonephila clavipes]
MYAVAVGASFVLMNDNAHHHRAFIVDNFHESEGMARMEWPAYSLDLNPIKNLWDALGCGVCRRFLPPPPFRYLETALLEKRRLLDSEGVNNLVTSMITLYTLSLKMKDVHTYSIYVCFTFKRHFVNEANMMSSYTL